jgi:dienelactone hydrolase
MNKKLIEKLLRIIGLTVILVSGILFLMVIIPLTAIIASEIWLPVSLLGTLYALFILVMLLLVVSLISSIRNIRNKAHKSQIRLDLLVILFLLIIPFCTISLYNAYKEPNTYIALSEFDQTGWVLFNATDWELNSENIRNLIDYLWGDKPELVPLNPQNISEVHEKGYTRIKMQITVENTGNPQWDNMSFFILIPDEPRATPCPLMIVHHQHAGRFDKGKEEPAGLMGDPRQALAVELVQQGYIVACHDALCFSERQEFSEKYTGMTMFMLNRTLNFKYCWDVSRLIDYLVTRPDVNASRIGIIGHSLGGQMAIWCAVYDARIRVIISNCGFGKLAGNYSVQETGTFQNYAYYIPGILKYDIRMEQIIGLLCNRSLLVSAGTEDYGLPINGVAEIHNWLEEQYSYYNASANIITLRHVGGHMIPSESKRQMYSFLDLKL